MKKFILGLLILSTLLSLTIICNATLIEEELIDIPAEEEIMPMMFDGCYTSQNSAMRAAKRSVGIPMSQLPTSTESEWIIGSNGMYYESITEIYGDKFIRADIHGHTFADGGTIPRHYNAGIINPDGTITEVDQHFWW